MEDKQKNIFLTEYEEGNKLVREYLKVSWTATSILLPITFGLVAVSLTSEMLLLTWNRLLPLAGASIFLYIYWGCYIKRYAGYLDSIFRRLRELEEDLGMNLHLRIDKRDKARPLRWRLVHVNFIMLELLVLLWILRLIYAPIVP